jgi:hypothetical protein
MSLQTKNFLKLIIKRIIALLLLAHLSSLHYQSRAFKLTVSTGLKNTLLRAGAGVRNHAKYNTLQYNTNCIVYSAVSVFILNTQKLEKPK